MDTKENIFYNCYNSSVRDGEQFIPEHVFSFQVSGKLTVSYAKEKKIFNGGNFLLGRRNSLAKFIKEPNGSDFRALYVFLPSEVLHELSSGFVNEQLTNRKELPPVLSVESHPALLSFVKSLDIYLNDSKIYDPLILKLKTKELILLLLKLQPELSKVLFNFNEPGKIDLEKFMLQNYRYNVPLEKLAYLSGRSMSSFKRDFEKIFLQSPGRWLTFKRLEDANYLMASKKMKAAEIYIDLGFENLSHFFTAFKRQYGFSPKDIHIQQETQK